MFLSWASIFFNQLSFCRFRIYGIRSSHSRGAISVVVIKIPRPTTTDQLVPYPGYCLTESATKPLPTAVVAAAVAAAVAACHRISIAEQTTEASRDRKTAGILIYIHCVWLGYIRAYVCSLARSQTFLTKPRSSFRPGYVAKAGIWDFRSVSSYRSLPRFPACPVLRWRLVADTSPLRAWIRSVVRDEMERRKRKSRREWTELRIGFGSRQTVLADRPPAGGIKRELWPNLCACSTVSLHRIGCRARIPETPTNCDPDYIAAYMDRNGSARERALTHFAAEQLLSLTAEARRREKESRRVWTSATNDLEITTFSERRGRHDSHPPELPPHGRYAGIFGPDYIVSAFPTRSLSTLGRELCSPVTTGDESKMNRRRKSRRPQAISTENFTGEFTLAYLMAPLHHQRHCRPHGDKVTRRCRRPALTLMMRNHGLDTRFGKSVRV